MTLRNKIAKSAAAFSRFGIRRFSNKDASNLPGRVALRIDEAVLANEIAKKISGKKLVVVGTNGKTSVTNLIAKIMDLSGKKILCNYSGANLKSGITSAVLSQNAGDVGIFESDELWLKETLKDLQADYVLLLNLFRDQLDRCGEIERIQSSVVEALRKSPATTLVFNADDPFCAEVAKRCEELEERKHSPKNITFGVDEPLNLKENLVSDTTMCQFCDSMLTYEFRQYDKVGKYRCEKCGFSRPELDFFAKKITMSKDGICLNVNVKDKGVNGNLESAQNKRKSAKNSSKVLKLKSKLVGSYNVYNILAASTAAMLLGANESDVQAGLDSFEPQNGRLQRYQLLVNSKECDVLLNLAKNPTGFNQNLRIIANSIDTKIKCAVAFFINDKIADGHDVSWLWDVDFEELKEFKNAKFYCGGTRALDMAVRLKYAAIESLTCENINECFEGEPEEIYAIANYTALPPVKKDLDNLVAKKGARLVCTGQNTEKENGVRHDFSVAKGEKKKGARLKIAHVMPELLNLYGDGGNVRILKNRAQWRGFRTEIFDVNAGDEVNFSDFDLVVIGGSPDREQEVASKHFMQWKDQIQAYIESGAPLLAICGSYQMLGKTWLLDGKEVEGLGILDMETNRPGTSKDRLVSNIVLKSKICKTPIIGFENHAGRTHLGAGLKPFGKVISKVGCGNSEESAEDGVLYKGLIGTYLHGPLLSKNPEVADWLLTRAIAHASKEKVENVELTKLDDNLENKANEFMLRKLS